MIDKDHIRDQLRPYLAAIECQPDVNRALCPLHNDHDPSLVISEPNGRPVWYCHVCKEGGDVFKLHELRTGERSFPIQIEEIAKIVGESTTHRQPTNKSKPANGVAPMPGVTETRVHPYHDADGRLLFEVVIQSLANRKKKVWQRQPDGRGGTRNGLRDIARPLPLFRLPELLESEDEVWIAEGEKDVESLRAQGVTATCNPMGSGKWKGADQEPLRGKDVVILSDNDQVGQDHAEEVARSLIGVARSIAVVKWSQLWTSMPQKADVSDALQEGFTIEEIRAAVCPRREPAVEFVEIAECPQPEAEPSTDSTNSTPPHRKHPVPEDSVLSDFLGLARKFTEAPDSFPIAAMLAVCARLLTPSLWMDFAGRKHPNIFQFIVAPPGIKKSTSLIYPNLIANRLLPPEALHQGNASDSALFSVFEAGPHRLQMESEANVVVSNWSGQHSGRELSNRYLRLYDGEGWIQTYRHQGEGGGEERRVVEQATLSLVMAGTFNCCRFAGIDSASGLRRRFGYYVEESPARMILWPEKTDDETIELVVSWFEPLTTLRGQVSLSPKALETWEHIQRTNREEIAAIIGIDESSMAKCHALAESPSRILKLSMIFEACRWAKDRSRDPFVIQPDTLEIAQAHQTDCILAAAELESIGRRAELIDNAEKVVSVVQSDNAKDSTNGVITMSKSDLTRRFAPNANRGMTAHRLHNEIMPQAIKRFNVVKAKRGNTTIYQFPVEG